MDVWKAYKAPELTRLPPSLDRTRTASGVVEAPSDTSTSVEISRPADLLKRLSALQQSDATKFKHLLGELGSNLKAAANSPSGVVGSELGQLADRILLAAKTGNLASLQSTASTARPSPTLDNRAQRAPSAVEPTELASKPAPSMGAAGSAAIAGEVASRMGVASAAMAAYRRHVPAAATPSPTVAQALDYVLAAVNDANR